MCSRSPRTPQLPSGEMVLPNFVAMVYFARLPSFNALAAGARGTFLC